MAPGKHGRQARRWRGYSLAVALLVVAATAALDTPEAHGQSPAAIPLSYDAFNHLDPFTIDFPEIGRSAHPAGDSNIIRIANAELSAAGLEAVAGEGVIMDTHIAQIRVNAEATLTLRLTDNTPRTVTLDYDYVEAVLQTVTSDTITITIHPPPAAIPLEYSTFNHLDPFTIDFPEELRRSAHPAGDSNIIRIANAELSAAGLEAVAGEGVIMDTHIAQIRVNAEATLTLRLTDNTPRTVTLDYDYVEAVLQTVTSDTITVTIHPPPAAIPLSYDTFNHLDTFTIDFPEIGRSAHPAGDSNIIRIANAELSAAGLEAVAGEGVIMDTHIAQIRVNADATLELRLTDDTPRTVTLDYDYVEAVLQTVTSDTITVMITAPRTATDTDIPLLNVQPSFSVDFGTLTGAAGTDTVVLSETATALAGMGISVESGADTNAATGEVTAPATATVEFRIEDMGARMVTLGYELRFADGTEAETGTITLTVTAYDPPAATDMAVTATQGEGMVEFSLDFAAVYSDAHDAASPVTVVTFYSGSGRTTSATLSDLGLAISGGTATENMDGTITIADPDGMASFTSSNTERRTIHARYTAAVSPVQDSDLKVERTADITITVPPPSSITIEAAHGTEFTVDFGRVVNDLAGLTIAFTVRMQDDLSGADLTLVSGATPSTGEAETSYEVGNSGMVVLSSDMAQERQAILDYEATGTGEAQTGMITINVNVVPVTADISRTGMHPGPYSVNFAESITDADSEDLSAHTITLMFAEGETADTAGLGISGATAAVDGSYTINPSSPTVEFTSVLEEARTVTMSYTVTDPNSNEATGAVTITVTVPVCTISHGTALDFGSLQDGDESAQRSLAISNTGNMAGMVSISGSSWTDSSGTTQMGAGQTRVSSESGDYGSKTELGSDAMELSSIPVEGSAAIYLQLRAELQDTNYAGDLSQTITIAVSCDTPDDAAAPQT